MYNAQCVSTIFQNILKCHLFPNFEIVITRKKNHSFQYKMSMDIAICNLIISENGKITN